MARGDRLNQDVWSAIVPFLIGISCLLGPSLFGIGALEIALGEGGWLYWPMVAVWLIAVIVAIRRTGWWWLATSGLAALFPAVAALVMWAECLDGNCL